MRLALFACVVSMAAVASAQTGARGPAVTKGAAAPPIIFPQPTLTPPPAGGLTPPVVFTPPLPAGARPIDMFRIGRRDPFRTRFYAPGVTGYGGYGGIGYGYEMTAPEPQAADAAAAAARPATGLLRLSVT